MDSNTAKAIVEILGAYRLMALATVRPDGWPQVTTVSYVNDGLKLYCFVSRFGQKFANIKHDCRVSAAISGEFTDSMAIRGLSLAAHVAAVDDPNEFDRMCNAFMKRFPEYSDWPKPSATFSPMLRIVPEAVSIVDYSKGFGHSEFVAIDAADFGARSKQHREKWFTNLFSR